MFLPAINKCCATASENQAEMKGRQCCIRTCCSGLGSPLFLPRRRSLHPPLDAVGVCGAGQPLRHICHIFLLNRLTPILPLQTPHDKMPSGHILEVIHENGIDQCSPGCTNDRHCRCRSLL